MNEKLLRLILKEAKDLLPPTSADCRETTFIILPSVSNFSTFLILVHEIEDLLTKSGLWKDIQVATFHPEYLFEGTESTAEENYTNRSPYPMLHLLRVKQVEQAIRAVDGNTDFVWQRNIALLKGMGIERIKREYDLMFQINKDM